MVKAAVLDYSDFGKDSDISFNMVFLETGEIRQKRRSYKWLMERVFYHEIRTAKRNRNETIIYDEETP